MKKTKTIGLILLLSISVLIVSDVGTKIHEKSPVDPGDNTNIEMMKPNNAVVNHLTADDSDKFAEAITITPGNYSGHIANGTDNDFYEIELEKGDLIRTELVPQLGSDFDIKLFDPSKTEVAVSSSSESREDDIIAGVSTSGTWYIWVYYSRGYGGTYDLTVDIIENNDGNSGSDAGNDRSTAMAIDGGPIVGTIQREIDEDDYYQFSATSGDMINVTIEWVNFQTTIDILLYDETGSQIAGDTTSVRNSLRKSISLITPDTGFYYVDVRFRDAPSKYYLFVSAGSLNDAGTGSDASDSNITAHSLSDTYFITVVSTDEDDILNYTLFDPNGQIIVNNKSTSGDLRLTESLIETNGTYHIFVELLEGKITNYDISFSLIPPEVNEEDTSIPLLWLIAGAAGILLVIFLSIYIIKRRKSNSQ